MLIKYAYTCCSDCSTKSVHPEIGLNPYSCSTPFDVYKTSTLPSVLRLEEAITSLDDALHVLQHDPPVLNSGVLRFQVPLPPEVKALQWLQILPHNPTLLPRIYFSQRGSCGNGDHFQISSKKDSTYEDFEVDMLQNVAGVGSIGLFQGYESFSLGDWKAIRRFLSSESPFLRAYGSIRFNHDVDLAPEWLPFGAFYFFIPQIELCEHRNFSMLAVNLAWDNSLGWNVKKALQASISALNEAANRSCIRMKHLSSLVHKLHIPDEQTWCRTVNSILTLLANEGETTSEAHASVLDPCVQGVDPLKVVLARRTEILMKNSIDPISLLSDLQEKDPVSYQFFLQLPDLSTFFGNTPERLFARKGLSVTSEAVAATRPRGGTEMEDHRIGIDLLQSSKDNKEFDIVHDIIKKGLNVVCKSVEVDAYKNIIKQSRVQHLYSHFSAEIEDESDEFRLLHTLHPTPAVCGHPTQFAKTAIALNEKFDRGLYAGPIGWFGSTESEFAVGIRSALLQKHSFGNRLYLYAGVGLVKGSNASSEWDELELKISQFENLLKPLPTLRSIQKVNALWAASIVEECCRLGITYFCIAPGSQSSPLSDAAAANPRVSCLPCTDEHSLASHALGYGRQTNKPAVVVTSYATAVSIFYQAVVEASQDYIPMIILTVDCDQNLQDSGESEEIHQVKHFGSFTRQFLCLPPPDDNLMARRTLATIDAALSCSIRDPRGPVHINCAFRESLESFS